MLYLVATPIGNLGDFSFRAVETLKSCDYILCEDTRRSGILLKHYGIDVRMRSFHMFNEARKEDEVIEDLKNGKKIALISDAGTPGINDPGERLVQRCKKEELPLSAIPGPCALITALTLSGLPTAKFQFLGFLPKKPSHHKRAIQEMLDYAGTSICYESPFRLIKSLKKICELDKDRTVCVARELTKTFEEVFTASAENTLAHFQKKTVKGEIALLINGKN